jgi:hypothetical protein
MFGTLFDEPEERMLVDDFKERMGTGRAEMTAKELDTYLSLWTRGDTGPESLALAAKTMEKIPSAFKVSKEMWRFELVRDITAMLAAEEGQKDIPKRADAFGKPVKIDDDRVAKIDMLKRMRREASNLVTCLDRNGNGLIQADIWIDARKNLPIPGAYDPQPPAPVVEIVVPMSLQQIMKPLCLEVNRQGVLRNIDKLIRRYDKDKSKLVDPEEFQLMVKFFTGYELTKRDL